MPPGTDLVSVLEVVAGCGPKNAANNQLYASWHLDSRESSGKRRPIQGRVLLLKSSIEELFRGPASVIVPVAQLSREWESSSMSKVREFGIVKR